MKLSATLSAVAVALIANSASAELIVNAEISARKVEVGETFRFSLSAMSDAGNVGTPSLKTPPGIAKSGPQIGTRTQMSMVGTRITRQMGIDATWNLQASKPGKYVIGPGYVSGPSGETSTGTVVVEVVKEGTLQRPPRGRSLFGPGFDPFGSGSSPFDRLLDGADRAIPEAPAEYQLESAPDRIAFVRAEVSPRNAVVGQQVTLRVYAYGARGHFDLQPVTMPEYPAFLSFPVMEPNARQTIHQVAIEDQIWYAGKFQEIALFPVETGTLTINPSKLGFVGRGYNPRDGGPLLRSSDALTVQVTAAPTAGRPAGFEQGNVGRFELTAEVEPRTGKLGDSIAVTAKLTGAGMLPRELKVPEQDAVEWLPPNVQEQMGFDRNGRYGGTRTFTFILRLRKAGAVDLGALELPYFNPQTKRYSTAHATLGQIHVSGSAAIAADTAQDDSAKADPADALSALANTAAVKQSQAGTNGAPRYWADRPLYWLGLLFGPSVVFGVAALLGSTRRLRGAIQRRSQSTNALLSAELKAAKQASQPSEQARALERALFLSIDAEVQLKARGVLREALPRELTRRGLPPDLAEQICALLERLERLRFGEEISGEALVTETSSLVRKISGASRGRTTV